MRLALPATPEKDGQPARQSSATPSVRWQPPCSTVCVLCHTENLSESHSRHQEWGAAAVGDAQAHPRVGHFGLPVVAALGQAA